MLTITAESLYLHLPLIIKLKEACNDVFAKAEYAFVTIPTYPSGQIGFMVCSKDESTELSKPCRTWSVEKEDRLLRYYNSRIHEASFVLPNFAKKELQKQMKQL